MNIRICKTKQDLAKMLRFKLSKITYMLHVMDKVDLYTTFEIDKKNGRKRIIQAPCEDLKILQRNLRKVLEECYKEIKQKKISAHGFLKNHSILTNARNHKNKRYVLNLDLKDFFPSIHFGRIYGFFKKNKHFQLNDEVAKLIAQIVCFESVLPQGSPCSPIISNLIAIALDKHLSIFASLNKCDYSRYADDITFSTNMREFPKNIAFSEDSVKWILGEELVNIIENDGFAINYDKTRMQYKTSRQETTGIVVNKKININRNYIRFTRAMLDNWMKNPNRDTVNVLLGYISYIYQVRSYKRKIDQNDMVGKLFYKFFYTNKCIYNEKITILTEGKTDKVYIDKAFKVLNENNKYQFTFEIIKHSNMATNLLGIGGDKKLKNIIKAYSTNIKKLKSYKQPNFPVIVIFDRDNFKELKIEELEKNAYLKREPNLYYLSLPKFDNNIEYFSIEYFFPEFLFGMKINEHKLEKKLEKIDTKTIYKIDEDKGISKNKFSQYIKKQKDPAIFSNFTLLFDLINNIYDDYKNGKS